MQTNSQQMFYIRFTVDRQDDPLLCCSFRHQRGYWSHRVALLVVGSYLLPRLHDLGVANINTAPETPSR